MESEAVDTNIMVYVDDDRDPRKQRIAAELMESIENGVLLWQVACEYMNVTRRLHGSNEGLVVARRRIHNLMDEWDLVMPDSAMIDTAMELLDRYSLSFWDSMIIAGCIHAGVRRLYTEDFDAYPRIGDLEIVNPFSTD